MPKSGFAALRVVNEHKAFGIKVELRIEPGLPAAQHVRSILLRGVGSLFLRVIP